MTFDGKGAPYHHHLKYFTLLLDPTINSLDPKFCYHVTRSLDFGVYLVLDPNINPP